MRNDNSRRILMTPSAKSILLAAAAVAAAGAHAGADTYRWTRAGGNNNWDNVNNWEIDGTTAGAPPTTPAEGTTTDILYSGPAGNTSSSLRQSYTISSLTFASDFTSTGTFNVNTPSTLLAGQTSADLTIGAGGITSDVTTFNINLTYNTAATPSANIILGADQTWTLNAPIAQSGAITFTVTRNIVGDHTITKNGSGLLVLAMTSSNSDWTGGIILNEGQIRTGGATGSHSGHFGTGAITNISEHDVAITASTVSGAGGDRLFANDLILGGTGRMTFGGSFNLGFTADSHWDLQSDKPIGVSFITDHAGTVGGTGGIIKYGGGMLVLHGDNTYQGGTTVNDGVLRVTHANALGTGPAPVDVNAGTSGGQLELASGITVSGKALTIAGGGFPSANPPEGVTPNAGALRSLGGNTGWTGPVTVTADAVIQVDSGTLSLPGGVSGGAALRVTTPNAGTVNAGHVRLDGALTLDAGVKLAISAGGTTDSTSRVGGLVLAGTTSSPTATFDLADNSLVIDYADASPAAEVRAALATSLAANWAGPGLTSSAAAGNSSLRIGYGEASLLLGLAGSDTADFRGVTADASSLLLRTTAIGDADLSGAVDLTSDFSLITAGIFGGGSDLTWAQGDFNYDGIADIDTDFIAYRDGFLATGGTSSQLRGAINASDLTAGQKAQLLAVIGGVPGDYNGDGFVDAADYTVWADHFGQSGTGVLGDGNGDGVVDAADYTVWADNFGQGTPPGGVAVPEPASLALLAAPMGLLVRRRRN